MYMCSQGLLKAQQCQGEIVLHPAADEAQKPKTAVQHLHLLSFSTAQVIFHVLM